jgi:carbonic anhydrase/acetyltransferase-like protein (isoleucine patch superfamily)
MIVEYDGYLPEVAESAFVAPTAVLIGNVIVREGASIWYGAVLRADHGEFGIIVGARSSVQDNCVIHVAIDHATTIGNDVTVGHGALLEGCTIDDGALIGMNAVILEHAHIGRRSLVAANSTVLTGTAIPAGVVAAGSPAKVKKTLEGQAARWIETSSSYYVDLARSYRDQGLDQTDS